MHGNVYIRWNKFTFANEQMGILFEARKHGLCFFEVNENKSFWLITKKLIWRQSQRGINRR